MKIHSARFKCSSEKVSQIPTDTMPDFAFIGRSNVGKSSLINMLVGVKGLAKVSGTPGKTRLINHFSINESWYMVDLPGYGYARTSKSARAKFSKLITDYIIACKRLFFLFVLVDSRLEPQKIDLEFIDLLGRESVPFGLVFTKCDKISSSERESNIARYLKKLSATWEKMPPLFITSSEKRTGRDEILDFIANCLEGVNN